jgi:hypothetical protein
LKHFLQTKSIKDKAFGGLKAESLAYISPVATPWV